MRAPALLVSAARTGISFIDDVDDFSASFTPPASAELLIGAYSDLMNRYRVYEARLTQKREFLLSSLPWQRFVSRPVLTPLVVAAVLLVVCVLASRIQICRGIIKTG